MARRAEQHFPVWNPSRSTREIFSENLIDSLHHSEKELKKRLYKTLRNTSSAFISRRDVREFIFNRDGNKCVLCDSIDNLQIDHIKSVATCLDGSIHYTLLNTEGNLQTLCIRCNASKKH